LGQYTATATADDAPAIAALRAEIANIESYLRDPGASRDTASRSVEAQAHHRRLTKALADLQS
jgi:ribosomal protein S11